MDDLARQRLCEIVVRHGVPATDPRRCESLLKDYCGHLQREIFVLVCAVREQVVVDLCGAHESVPRDLLHTLLTKRLQQNLSLTEEAARWAVESWTLALEQLQGAGDEPDGPEGKAVATPASAESAPAISQVVMGLKSVTSREHERSSAPRSFTGGASLSAPSSAGRGTDRVVGRCESPVRSVAFARDGTFIASGSDDGIVRLWDVATGAAEFIGQAAGAISSIALSLDDSLLAAASSVGAHEAPPVVHLWELQTGERHELGACGRRAPVVAFSPDNVHVASGSADPEAVLRVWNVETGRAQDLGNVRGGLPAVAYAPDGLSIATGDGSPSNAALRLWDLRTGESRVLGRCARRISAVAFAPDGDLIATGSWDEAVCQWSVARREARILGKGCSYINCVAYAPDGERVAASSLDGKIRAWDVRTGRATTVREFPGTNSIAFSADGLSLVAGSSRGVVRLWGLA
jgi:WD40 repeat protein